MFPACFGGADGLAENLLNLAALTAKALRQASLLETVSSIFALSTSPEGETVISTVTLPAPMHLYAGMGSLDALRPSRLYDTTEGPE